MHNAKRINLPFCLFQKFINFQLHEPYVQIHSRTCIRTIGGVLVRNEFFILVNLVTCWMISVFLLAWSCTTRAVFELLVFCKQLIAITCHRPVLFVQWVNHVSLLRHFLLKKAVGRNIVLKGVHLVVVYVGWTIDCQTGLHPVERNCCNTIVPPINLQFFML